MKEKVDNVKICIFFGIIVISIITQYLISDIMENISTPMIVYFQKNYPLLSKQMTILGLVGSRKLKTLMIAFLFSVCNYYYTFLFIFVTFFSVFISSWLKINLQEPRPFWIEPEVQAIACETGYGYPSNHVLPTVPSTFLFFEMVYYRFNLDKGKYSQLIYWTGMVTCGLVVAISGMTRMIVGVHSLDQVVFGLFIGLGIYYFFSHIISYDLKNIKMFLRIVTNFTNGKILLFVLIVIYLAFTLNSVLLNIDYNSAWSDEIFNKCGRLPVSTPFYGCFTSSGSYFIIISSLLGLLYNFRTNYIREDNHLLVKEYVEDNLEQTEDGHVKRIGKWNDTSIPKAILRIVVIYFVIYTIIVIPLRLKRLTSPCYYTEFLANEFVPHVILGFILFAYGKKICSYLCLIN